MQRRLQSGQREARPEVAGERVPEAEAGGVRRRASSGELHSPGWRLESICLWDPELDERWRWSSSSGSSSKVGERRDARGMIRFVWAEEWRDRWVDGSMGRYMDRWISRYVDGYIDEEQASAYRRK